MKKQHLFEFFNINNKTMINTAVEKHPDSNALHTGDTIRTFEGNYVDVLNPDPGTIEIDDIAHGLSQICRFAGHTKKFFSVAQHSVECVQRLQGRTQDKKILLTMLMHDATEAYIGDLARPIKRRIPQYKTVENILMDVIATKYDLHFPFPPVIKKIDNLQLEIEHNGLMRCSQYLECMEPKDAKQIFLAYYSTLTK